MAARKTPSELGRSLLTRGLWQIVVEWFVISTAFTFAPGGLAAYGHSRGRAAASVVHVGSATVLHPRFVARIAQRAAA